MRFFIGLIAAALAATGVFAGVESPADTYGTLTVAVRNDSPPFAYRRNDKPNAETRMEGYGGFIVDICQQALTDMSIPQEKVRVLGVSVTERFDPIDSGQADILCAPVSITPERLEKYLFSMPVFLSGISFITTPLQVDSNRKKNIVGALGNTTALERLESGALEQLFGKHFATAITESAAGLGSHESAIRELSNYEQGYKLICQGKLIYMLGDIDILAYHLQSDRIGCKAFLSQATISREVLAILFSPQFVFDKSRQVNEITPNRFFMRFQKTIFSIFQDHQKIESLFKKHFPGKTKSQELDAFFRNFMRFPHAK
jgi:ABC-type amino acid transport substrate-binding protein